MTNLIGLDIHTYKIVKKNALIPVSHKIRMLKTKSVQTVDEMLK